MQEESNKNRKKLSDLARRLVQPPPDLKVSQWAQENRILSREASALPGKWRNDVAPYQVEIMDSVNDPSIQEIVICSASQVGKTEILLNIIGYFIDQDPSPMLQVLPTLELAESWSKDRLANMIRDTECLRNQVKDVRTRDSGNTLLHKKFPGGHITLCGANAPSSLASRPVRVVLFDEVSKFPKSAGTEGDPVSLAKRRAITFYNRKFIAVSTPTDLATCRIWMAFQNTDMRKFYMPCLHCGFEQTLEWEQMRWEPGKPDSARMVCKNEKCIREITDGDKIKMLANGKWKAEKESKKRGYHISSLYSPAVRFSELVSEYEEAKSNTELMKVFVNTILGLPWEESEERIEHHLLYMRREHYKAEVPKGVLVLTAGVDVQDDRLCIEVVGWGVGEESWSIDYLTLYGDPDLDDVWVSLDDVRQKRFKHESGITMQIAALAVDTGGHHTQKVYHYCRERSGFRVFAVKGFEGAGRVLVAPPSQKRSGRDERHVDLFPVGVDGGKAQIYSRLRLCDPGAGFCHFPISPRYPERFFEELTAERVAIRYSNGFPVKRWILPSGKRNEALDCRVYALAALSILDPLWEAVAARVERQAMPTSPEEEQTRKRPPKRSWVNAW
jgi:phage terminase large subunit GpA-like protein